MKQCLLRHFCLTLSPFKQADSCGFAFGESFDDVKELMLGSEQADQQ